MGVYRSTFVDKSPYLSSTSEEEEMVPNADTVVGESDITTVDALKTGDADDAGVFFGERIVSLRSIIKRYCLVNVSPYSHASPSDEFAKATIGITRYLPYYPPLANYFQKFQGGIPYAGFRKNCFPTYMMPCYLVARGSTRYKSIINNIYAQAGNDL